MKPVLYKGKNQAVPGIAVAGINPGGWAFLDIYIALSKNRSGMSKWAEDIGAYIHVSRRNKRGKKLEYENFDTIECRGPDKDKVTALEMWPVDLMLLPSGYELDVGSHSLLELVGQAVK